MLIQACQYSCARLLIAQAYLDKEWVGAAWTRLSSNKSWVRVAATRRGPPFHNSHRGTVRASGGHICLLFFLRLFIWALSLSFFFFFLDQFCQSFAYFVSLFQRTFFCLFTASVVSLSHIQLTSAFIFYFCHSSSFFKVIVLVFFLSF